MNGDMTIIGKKNDNIYNPLSIMDMCPVLSYVQRMANMLLVNNLWR